MCKVNPVYAMHIPPVLKQRLSSADMAFRDSRTDVLQPNSRLPWGLLLHYNNLPSARKLISELSGSYEFDKDSEARGRLYLNALDLPKGGADIAPLAGYT